MGVLNADLILVDGRVVIVDFEDSIAEAVAVRDGWIVAVGNSSEVMEFAGDGTRVVDLGGRTVLPGLIDSHTHPSGAAVRFLEVDCRSPPVESVGEILELVAARAVEVGPGRWIRGANYNDIKLREKRHITRWELDEAAPGLRAGRCDKGDP
jgi:predicted amidohydrolase YtcJ